MTTRYRWWILYFEELTELKPIFIISLDNEESNISHIFKEGFSDLTKFLASLKIKSKSHPNIWLLKLPLEAVKYKSML